MIKATDWELDQAGQAILNHRPLSPSKEFKMNHIFRQSADKIFRPASVEKGSDAEKLQTLRKEMQKRLREQRQTERTVREASRLQAQRCSVTWRATT